jgi:hypothetical protein
MRLTPGSSARSAPERGSAAANAAGSSTGMGRGVALAARKVKRTRAALACFGRRC